MVIVGQKYLKNMNYSWKIILKILLVTEKYNPQENQRDGGATLIKSLIRAFGESLTIMQFGSQPNASCKWNYSYPHSSNCRFEKRILNADYIGHKVSEVQNGFTHILFVHISMQFGALKYPINSEIMVWTFPMFLTPSYVASGEKVPDEYTSMERFSLTQTQNILTPSRLEKQQLLDFYNVPEEKIHVIPRGIDTTHIKTQVRQFNSLPIFCSIGSIKPQKNTLGLINLFSLLHQKYPEAKLRIIGPIQNDKYYRLVVEEVKNLGLSNYIEFTGFIDPQQITSVLKDCHLHLSVSTCETFGRSIFESLAAGLPNIAMKQENAAAEYLGHLPYARFVDNMKMMIAEVDYMLEKLEILSSLATEIGGIYNDTFLSQMMAAKIMKLPTIAISDFDGTLYHKDDVLKTTRSFKAFKNYTLKVICSARPLNDILKQLQKHELEVEWIIAYGGAIIAQGCGKVHYEIPLNHEDVDYLRRIYPEANTYNHDKELLQFSISNSIPNNVIGYRVEQYQQESFISNWKASKLHAVQKLLFHINWQGQVLVFGDGPYDNELLTYFDGIKVTPFPTNNREKKEVIYV
jgi:glycosyltransferase involved in cell wall biosynthesis/hydroxymethylpyrimidine pyrophosphatase-like HAD family hydrolase